MDPQNSVLFLHTSGLLLLWWGCLLRRLALPREGATTLLTALCWQHRVMIIPKQVNDSRCPEWLVMFIHYVQLFSWTRILAITWPETIFEKKNPKNFLQKRFPYHCVQSQNWAHSHNYFGTFMVSSSNTHPHSHRGRRLWPRSKSTTPDHNIVFLQSIKVTTFNYGNNLWVYPWRNKLLHGLSNKINKPLRLGFMRRFISLVCSASL